MVERAEFIKTDWNRNPNAVLLTVKGSILVLKRSFIEDQHELGLHISKQFHIEHGKIKPSWYPYWIHISNVA